MTTADYNLFDDATKSNQNVFCLNKSRYLQLGLKRKQNILENEAIFNGLRVFHDS